MKPKKPIILTNFYFPGLISIVLLPITCIVYLYFFKTVHVLPVLWFDKAAVERSAKGNPEKVDFKNFRNYTNLYLTGDQKHDHLEVEKLTIVLHGLVETNDLKNGVCVSLTDKTKYQDLVTTLDIGLDHKTISVIPYYDKIYLFNVVPNPKVFMSMPCVGVNRRVINDINLPSTFFDELQADFSNQSSKFAMFWPCLIPSIGMIFFWRSRKKFLLPVTN